MLEKHPAILVVGPGPALRWAMEELKRRYDYHLIYAATAYDAGQLLENTAVDAVVCEVAPAYSSECRLLQEICQRSPRLAVFLFVEPEAEEYLYDELAHGTFYVVRPSMRLADVHHLIQAGIARRRQKRTKVA